MKILNVTLIVLIALAIVFWIFFYYSVRVARETTVTLQATSTASMSPRGSVLKMNSSTTPANFRGPSGQPTMHGPSSNPPNY